MRLGFGAVTVGVLLAPAAARADFALPGFSRVAGDKVIEVAGDTAGYRFWLLSPRGAEPLDLAPGRPCRVDGQGRDGSHSTAYVVAAPAGVVERVGPEELWDVCLAGKLPPEVLRSGSIDFRADVPFLDPRRRVTDHYRLEFVPGERLELVRLGRSVTDRLMSFAWVAACLGLVGAVVWAGVRWARRGRRAAAV